MTDNIIIRKANSDDLAAILALINAPHADNGTAMELRDANSVYQSILDDPNYFQIVASTEKGIVGIVTLVIIVQMTHEGMTSALITDMITAEVDNKTKVAAQLLQYATNLAQEYGCYKTIFQCDYQPKLTSSTCSELGFEESTPCYLLPDE
jgi:N-acetylglutamate synthase-like GNAT family acetyltransferase